MFWPTFRYSKATNTSSTSSLRSARNARKLRPPSRPWRLRIPSCYGTELTLEDLLETKGALATTTDIPQDAKSTLGDVLTRFQRIFLVPTTPATRLMEQKVHLTSTSSLSMTAATKLRGSSLPENSF